LCVVVAIVGWGAWFVHRHTTVIVPDSYALEWVGDLVLEYMNTHGDRWPKSWDDLNEPFKRHDGQPAHFEDLQRRVEVDWNADPGELAKTPDGAKPFRVIWLKDGGDWYWSGYEPNRRVWEYLNKGR
jgi:hypothetical protein